MKPAGITRNILLLSVPLFFLYGIEEGLTGILTAKGFF
jgi:hypothetical protein